MKVHTSNYAISGFTSERRGRGARRARRARTACRSRSISAAARWWISRTGNCRRNRPCARRSRPARIWSRSAATSCSAARRPACWSAAPISSRKLQKNPLKRALRVGKLTLAALEPVLALYRAPEFLAERLTTLRLLTRAPAAMQAQALRLQPIVQRAVGDAYEVARCADVEPDRQRRAARRSAAQPWARDTRASRDRRGSLDRLDAALRALPRPVLGRIADKTLLARPALPRGIR